MRIRMKVQMSNADNLIFNVSDSNSLGPVFSSTIEHYLRWTMCQLNSVCNLVLPCTLVTFNCL